MGDLRRNLTSENWGEKRHGVPQLFAQAVSLGSLPHRAEVPASLQLLPWCPCAASRCRSSYLRAWLFCFCDGICNHTWWGVQPLSQLTLPHTTSYHSLEWPRHFSVSQEPAKTAAGGRPALGRDTTAASLPARGGHLLAGSPISCVEKPGCLALPVTSCMTLGREYQLLVLCFISILLSQEVGMFSQVSCRLWSC